ncbi:MAG: tyrosine-type recombinase/integrase [Planctomycetaceae bacterium]|nr:tyrosine-type recombinase/integrase [Planctomycetaceae bacterium]
MSGERYVPWNRGRRLPAEPLVLDEVRKLIGSASGRSPTGIRNRALIVALYRGGLRCSEALDLFPKDCNLGSGTIRILCGKGGRSRVVGIDPEAAGVIQRWLDRRVALGLTGRYPVFCTLDGKPLQPVYVRNLLRRLGQRAGIDKRVHPHGLRHTHAYELANENFPLHVIQQQLGHSSLATTDRYIRHLSAPEVVERMKSRKCRLEAPE